MTWPSAPHFLIQFSVTILAVGIIIFVVTSILELIHIYKNH